MNSPRILAFGGSLRRDSFNQKLAAIAAEGARETGAEVTLIRGPDGGEPPPADPAGLARGLGRIARQLYDAAIVRNPVGQPSGRSPPRGRRRR